MKHLKAFACGFKVAFWLVVRYFQIRALETQLDGIATCLEYVTDPILSGRIIINRSLVRKELCRVRGEFNALLAPGNRVVWRMG